MKKVTNKEKLVSLVSAAALLISSAPCAFAAENTAWVPVYEENFEGSEWTTTFLEEDLDSWKLVWNTVRNRDNMGWDVSAVSDGGDQVLRIGAYNQSNNANNKRVQYTLPKLSDDTSIFTKDTVKISYDLKIHKEGGDNNEPFYVRTDLVGPDSYGVDIPMLAYNFKNGATTGEEISYHTGHNGMSGYLDGADLISADQLKYDDWYTCEIVYHNQNGIPQTVDYKMTDSNGDVYEQKNCKRAGENIAPAKFALSLVDNNKYGYNCNNPHSYAMIDDFTVSYEKVLPKISNITLKNADGSVSRYSEEPENNFTGFGITFDKDATEVSAALNDSPLTVTNAGDNLNYVISLGNTLTAGETYTLKIKWDGIEQVYTFTPAAAEQDGMMWLPIYEEDFEGSEWTTTFKEQDLDSWKLGLNAQRNRDNMGWDVYGVQDGNNQVLRIGAYNQANNQGQKRVDYTLPTLSDGTSIFTQDTVKFSYDLKLHRESGIDNTQFYFQANLLGPSNYEMTSQMLAYNYKNGAATGGEISCLNGSDAQDLVPADQLKYDDWYTCEIVYHNQNGVPKTVDYKMIDSDGRVFAQKNCQRPSEERAYERFSIILIDQNRYGYNCNNPHSYAMIDDFSISYKTPISELSDVTMIDFGGNETEFSAAPENSLKAFKLTFDKNVPHLNVTLNGKALTVSQKESGVYIAELDSWVEAGVQQKLHISWSGEDAEYIFTPVSAKSVKIGELSFYQGNTKITDWTLVPDGEEITLRAVAYNTTGKDQTACISYATYKNGMMKNAGFFEDTVPNSMSGKELTKTFTADKSSIDEINGFVWESLNTLKAYQSKTSLKEIAE